MGTIVVGVDGSEGSRQALLWAFSEAVLRKAEISAVAVWQVPTFAYPQIPVAPPVVELADAAGEALATAVAEVRSGLSGTEAEVVVHEEVVEGPSAATLIARSEDAELLVVGSRGFGGFRGLLLGSVSHQCASHARCPVVVVPTRDPQGV